MLDSDGARHIRTPPYTPRWNGKVERFIQTLQSEWAYGRTWPSSAQRARALLTFLRYYNRSDRTAHSETGHRSAAFTTSVGRTASRDKSAPRAEDVVSATERRRSRTYPAWGYQTSPVLKTGWATGPCRSAAKPRLRGRQP